MSLLPLRTRIGYALGSITTGTYGTVPGLILMPYLTDHLGVAAALAGLIAFAPRALDFVLNPIAGRMSDRAGTSTRRPFLIWAGALLAFLFMVLFFGPTEPVSLAGLWVLLFSLCAATAYAFFQVPFLAMAAEITDDYAERTRVMAWRVAFLGVAILFAGGSAPLLVQLGDGSDGYRILPAALCLVSLAPIAHYRLDARLRAAASQAHEL